MRDYRDAKTMAKGLRRSLAELGTDLTHSQSLELIAQAFGFDNWNILAAKIEASRPAAAADKRPDDETLHCSFCSKPQHDVRLLIAGPGTAICDECVALCDGVVDDNEVEGHLRDLSPEADPAATPEASLAGYTTEQLAAYLARAEKRLADSQLAIDGLDGDGADLPTWMQAQGKPEKAKTRARLAAQVAKGRNASEIVARVLAARP
jgi:hypothetical protein